MALKQDNRLKFVLIVGDIPSFYMVSKITSIAKYAQTLGNGHYLRQGQRNSENRLYLKHGPPNDLELRFFMF